MSYNTSRRFIKVILSGKVSDYAWVVNYPNAQILTETSLIIGDVSENQVSEIQSLDGVREIVVVDETADTIPL